MPQPKVLALSSGGGHWVQLLRLRPAFAGCNVTFATVNAGYAAEIEGMPFRVIIDSNRDQKLRLIGTFYSIARTLISVRPDVVLSTGAAPGYFALRLGKLLGAKTVWIDSVANAEELSLSGQKAGRFADLWLTQWAHLARPEGPSCLGNVIGDVDAPAPMPLAGAAKTASVAGRPLNIFLTVGSDVPFDRFVRTVDQSLEDGKMPHRVFAQIGNSDYRPKNFEAVKFLSPSSFQERLRACDVIVAHAGMGTILSAMKNKVPILVFPRHGSLGETRNEHQLATARQLLKLGAVDVAFTEDELRSRLRELGTTQSRRQIPPHAPESFTGKLNTFLHRCGHS